VAASPNAITVEAVPGKEPSRRAQWFWFFIALTGGWRQIEARRQYPSLWAVNRVGQRRLLFRTSTWDEAVTKVERVRRELAEMGVEAWAKRYSVPDEFIARTSPPQRAGWLSNPLWRLAHPFDIDSSTDPDRRR